MMRHLLFTVPLTSAIASLMLLTPAATFAGAKTWNGNVSTDWGNASNWGGGVPGSSDDATIPSSPSGGRWPTISSGTYALKKLIFQANASVDQTGGTLQLNNNYVSGSGSTFNATGESSNSLRVVERQIMTCPQL